MTAGSHHYEIVPWLSFACSTGLTTAAENFANAGCQIEHRERLGQQLHARLHEAVTYGGILGIAGNEQHLEAWSKRARRVGKLATVHAIRQADVGDHHVD